MLEPWQTAAREVLTAVLLGCTHGHYIDSDVAERVAEHVRALGYRVACERMGSEKVELTVVDER